MLGINFALVLSSEKDTFARFGDAKGAKKPPQLGEKNAHPHAGNKKVILTPLLSAPA